MKSIVIATASLLAVDIAAMPSADAQSKLDNKQAAAVFGARERILDASLSPDGERVAIVSPGPAQATVVQVLNLKTGQAAAVNYADGKPLTLRSCGWVSSARLVCSMYGISNREGGWQGYSRLIAMDADGTNVMPLGVTQRMQDYISSSDGYVVDWRDGKSDQVLIARNYVPLKSNGITVGSKAQGLGVDLLNTRTGKVDHVESADPIAVRYLADGRGNVRIRARLEAYRHNWQSDGKTTFEYRAAGDRGWKPFSVYNSYGDTGLWPVAVDGQANVAYALEKTSGRQALYRIALDGSMTKTLAYADPVADVDNVVRIGRRGRVVGATYSHERRLVHFFDPEYETLVTRLGRALPKLPMLTVIDSSADEQVHLIYAASDTDPGRYFVYDAKAKNLTPLGSDRPEMEGLALGQMRPITYRAADGTIIPAYLTLPAGSSGKNLPAIVMPHGGPASRDEWGFDWLAQFFANRGYAVIQPNFRGSSGYGDEWFRDNGFKSWKVAVGDVADAGKWLIGEGIADAKKLAIVGWSYGGYAALQSQVLAPGLFKATVAIAPVADLGTLRAERGAFDKVGQDYIGEGPHLRDGSPARNAGAFAAPVLLFHGTKDVNVNVDQSKLMDRELKSAGKRSQLVIYPDIDHQLPDTAVRTDMLSRTASFLDAAVKTN